MQDLSLLDNHLSPAGNGLSGWIGGGRYAGCLVVERRIPAKFGLNRACVEKVCGFGVRSRSSIRAKAHVPQRPWGETARLIRVDRHIPQLYNVCFTLLSTLIRSRVIRDQINRLHAIGFAHNDLNPKNFMADENDLPVSVDFESCERLGDKMGPSRGTPG